MITRQSKSGKKKKRSEGGLRVFTFRERHRQCFVRRIKTRLSYVLFGYGSQAILRQAELRRMNNDDDHSEEKLGLYIIPRNGA